MATRVAPTTPSHSPTTLAPFRYLALFRADAERLAAVVATHGRQAPVPACPGWSVGDVLTHTAAVYRRQAAAIRLGRRPSAGEWEEPPAAGASLEEFRAALAGMLNELAGRDPSSPAFTRWPQDPTAGFWYRRMALETVIHRVDVESAYGDRTPIDNALAVDGIDEVLTVFLMGSWAGVPEQVPGDPQHGAVRTVAVRSGHAEWHCRVSPGAVDVVRTGDTAGTGDIAGAGSRGALLAAELAASVDGSPETVLLWLWGRAADDAVRLGGDPDVLQAFRGRLQIATQ